MKDIRIINDLIVEYFRVKKSKILSITKQQYENAAKLRDYERKIAYDFYKIIDEEYKVDGVGLYGPSENTLQNYCNIKYPGLSDDATIKCIIRDDKLNELGL